MRVPVSFFELLQEGVRVVFQSKPLLILLFPLGLVLYGAALQSQTLSETLLKDIGSLPELFSFLQEHYQTVLSIFGFTLFTGILRALLRGPIFLLLEQTLLKQFPKKTDGEPLYHKKYFLRSSLFSFLFEGSYWLTLLLLSVIVLSPLPLTFLFNPGLTATLFELATILLLVLAALFFYIKEFSLLYVLLAHIKPRLALELGLRLFQKHLALSLLFGAFLILLSFFFTFLLNFAIITSALVPYAGIKYASGFLSGSFILGFATLLMDALHLLFFHALAATPQIKLKKLGKILEEKKSVSSTPTG